MPAAPTTVKDLVTLIVRSKLMSADDLRAAIAHLKPTGKEADELDAVRKVLVAGKHLTDYQMALVQRGHTDGFFLGPYKVLELIAKGRMAGVYKAAHASGQIVAIKVLPASKAKDPETLARFRREARLLTKLDHPNVVRAFHYGEADGKNYLVLEYLEGNTLEDVLQKKGRLTPVEAAFVIHRTLLGLQHIHERGMIHRDINPGNLMLIGESDSGATPELVKILDIGLGKAVFDESSKSPVDDPSQLTTDGVLIGTPDYLAPEQARSARTADIRSDIYSLGCVFYHTLTGQSPFPDKSILNQVMRHATETPRPLSDFLSPVPDGLQNVLNWMMAKDPTQRYATPERAAQAVTLFQRHSPTEKPNKAPVPDYVKWLESSPEADPGRPLTVPANIPIGKLETPGRKPEPSKAAEPKKPAAPVATSAPQVMPLPRIDVELIPMPPPIVPRNKGEDDEPRGLFELNRRDAFMLVAGGLLVVLAILAGWGLSQLFRREPPPEQPQQVVPDKGGSSIEG